jgi:hypothetical protein
MFYNVTTYAMLVLFSSLKFLLVCWITSYFYLCNWSFVNKGQDLLWQVNFLWWRSKSWEHFCFWTNLPNFPITQWVFSLSIIGFSFQVHSCKNIKLATLLSFVKIIPLACNAIVNVASNVSYKPMFLQFFLWTSLRRGHIYNSIAGQGYYFYKW